MPERLLDDDPRVLRQAGIRQSLDHRAEQERRDLEVEHRALRIRNRSGHPLEGVRIAEVAGYVGQSLRKPLEDVLVNVSDRRDRVAGALAQVVDRPVVDRDADDRAVQQAAGLQVVQRLERHHPREVAGDAEHDQHVGRLLPTGRGHPCAGLDCRSHRRGRKLRLGHTPGKGVRITIREG